MNRLLSSFILILAFHFSQAQCYQVIGLPVGTDSICDETSNEMDFWNQSYWFDSLNQSHNLAEISSEFRLVVYDPCHTSPKVSYLMQLDLDGNDTLETAVFSDSLPGPDSIMYGNMIAGSISGGEARGFDQRSIPQANKFAFSFQQTPIGDSLICRVRWSPGNNPAVFINPIMPHVKGRIWWFIQSDPLYDTLHYDFVIRDCQEPDVHCLVGQNIQIHANDSTSIYLGNVFLSAEDNITPEALLKRSIRKAGTGNGFPLDSSGNAVIVLDYSCPEIGHQLVEVWARDKAQNAGKCVVSIEVLDDSLYCAGPPSIKACSILPSGMDLLEVIFLLEVHPPTPATPYTLFEIADTTNCEEFPGYYNGDTLILTPSRNFDWLNGVSTLDLVKISKHILGIEPLPSPLSVIAADANRSGAITTFDIVQLRKLILGVIQEIPGNSPWRFVDASYAFQNPANPFGEAFPEQVKLAPYIGTVDSFVFVAIKTGDVNGSAAPNVQQDGDERSGRHLEISNTSISSGSEMEIPVYLSDLLEINGLQLGLRILPEWATLIDVKSPLPYFTQDSWAFLEDGQLNVSWFAAQKQRLVPDQPVLWIKIRANRDLSLAEALRGSERLKAEAYDEKEKVIHLELRFKGQNGEDNILISEPTPNPGSGDVHFSVNGGKRGRVEIYDLEGRMVFAQEYECTEGLQELIVPSSAFSGSAVYWWRIQVGELTRNGKIVRE